MKLLLPLLLTLVAAMLAPASWGPASCSAVAGPDISNPYFYFWHDDAKTPQQLNLWRKGSGPWVFAGAFFFDHDAYFPMLDYGTSKWGAACKPPCDIPQWAKDKAKAIRDAAKAKAAAKSERPGALFEAWQTHGVIEEKLPKDSHCHFSVNGVPVQPTEAFHALAGDDLKDDSGLPHLIVSTEDQGLRERIISDLDKLPDLKSAVRVWVQPPSHWSMNDFRAKKSLFPQAKGGVTVALLDPAGKVLHRQEDYRGAQDLEAIRQAVRQPDPNYDPAKDRDLRDPLTVLKNVPTEAWVVLGGLLLAFWWRRQQGT